MFWLLFIYVASGLGLLLTTSFLGLRRYLRQRRIEMPTMMANLWLSTGGAIIAALLLAAALLPRPSAEFAISQLPVTLGSPQQSASRMAPLDDDGTKDDQQGTAAERESAESDSDDQRPPEGTGNQPGGQSQGEASGGDGSETQGQGSGDSKQSSGQGEPSKQSKGSASEKGDDQGKSQSESNQDASQKSQSSQRQQEGSKPEPSKTGKPPESEFARNLKKYRETQKELAKEYGDKSSDEQAEESSAKQSEASEPAGEDASDSLQVPESVESAGGFLLTALKWAFYGLFALGVLFALWHFRREVLAAIRGFLDELRAFWQGLFSGKRIAGGAAADVAEIRVPPAPFASYADPFSSGTFARTSPEELVRYSFEAFEAWSREHGCPRATDQTPHELVRDVARLNAHIAADARNLAELYAKAAFSRGRLPDATPEQLRQLWVQMTRREAVSTL